MKKIYCKLSTTNEEHLGLGGAGNILDDVRVTSIGDAQAADAEELTAGSAKIDVVYKSISIKFGFGLYYFQ